MKCSTCEFWSKKDENWGTCKISPPMLSSRCVRVGTDELWVGIWPGTKPIDSCGGYKAANLFAETVEIGSPLIEE